MRGGWIFGRPPSFFGMAWFFSFGLYIVFLAQALGFWIYLSLDTPVSCCDSSLCFCFVRFAADSGFNMVDLQAVADVLWEDVGLVNVSSCKELMMKVKKQQSHWCKPAKAHDKIRSNYVNFPRKAHMYRIQQPRAVM